MTLLYGQFPRGAFLAGQFVLHATVGSVYDPIPPIPPPPDDYDWRGYAQEVEKPRVHLKRNEVMAKPPELEEDLLAVVAVFVTLSSD